MGVFDGGGSPSGSSAPSGGGLFRDKKSATKTSTTPTLSDDQKKQIAQQTLNQTLGDDSFLGKISSGIEGAVAGVPRGLVLIGQEAVNATKILPTVLAKGVFRQSQEDLNNNPLLRNITNPGLLIPGSPEANGATPSDYLGNAEEQFPVLESVARGFGQTGAELDPRGGFANLRRNYGRDPVGAGLNDAANIGALFTGGASVAGKGAEVLESAGLASAAAKAEKVATLANKTAMLPFKPYEMLAKAPARIGERSLALLKDAGAENRTPTKFQTVTAKLSPPSKGIQGEILRGRSFEETTGAAGDKRALVVNKVVPDLIEQKAMLPIGEQTAPALAALRRADPVMFPKFVTERYGDSLPLESANLAADIVEGKAAPEVAARINEGLRVGRELPGGRAERNAAYYETRPGQAGYEPNQAVLGQLDAKAAKAIDAATIKAEALRARADKASLIDVNKINERVGAPDSVLPISDPATAGNLRANTQIGRAEGNAHQLDLAARKAERDVVRLSDAADRARANAEYAVKNAPSRLKPVLAENRAVAQHLVGRVNELRGRGLPDAAKQLEDALNDLPTTLDQLKQQGIDPEHFFHTNDQRAVKGAQVARNAGLPRPIKPGSERLRSGDPVYDRTVKGQAQGEREVAVAALRREAADRIAAVPGAVEHLGQGELGNARTLEDARALGYSPWNPKSMFDSQGNVKPLSEIEAAAGIEHPTTFMPTPLFEQFRNYFEPVKGQALGLLTDLPNRLYYMKRLALSPGYVTGQVFGNAFLGAASSSSPVLFFKNAYRQLQSIRKTGEFTPEIGPRLLRSGGHQAELARLGQDVTTPRGGAIGGALAKVTGGFNKVIAGEAGGKIGSKLSAFKAAAFLDNLSRAAFYMTELEKRGGNAEAALEATLRGMGEFDKMTPWERDYVRRVVPMYAWHREITKIAFHLAEDHPLRVAWTLHIGNTVGQPDGPLPDFYMGKVPFGDYLVDPGQFFPFGEVGSTVSDPVHAPGKYAGPAAKIPFAQLTGVNLATMKPYTRPGGTTGPPQAPPLWKMAFDSLVPFSGEAQALMGQKDTAQYASGDEIKIAQPMNAQERSAYIADWHKQHPGEKVKFPKVTIPSGQGALTAISSLFGVPLYDRKVAEQSGLDQATRAATAALPKPPKTKAATKAKGGGIFRK